MIKSKILVVGSFFIIALGAFLGCDKKVGKLPEPEVVTPISSCDTITYSKYIKSIISKNCALSGCHDGSNSNPNLGNFNELKNSAERVKNRAVDNTTSTRMPPLPAEALTQSEKQLINCWIENGKKE
jgi:uncharacterized membrane protein